MNKKQFLRSMGEIDDRFIEEAETARPGRRGIALKWLSAAACLVMVCAVLLIPVMSGGRTTGDIDIDVPLVWNAEKGIFEYAAMAVYEATGEEMTEIAVPEWDAMQVHEKYKTIEGGAFAGYIASCREIGAESVGEKLEEVTVTGYDVYEDETHRVGAAVYAIRNADLACAVCVKYENSDGYYVFFNAEAKFATLGEFSGGFGLEEYLVFRNSFSDSYWKGGRIEEGLYKADYYRLSDLSMVYGRLFSDPNAPCIEMENRDYIQIIEKSENSIGISVDCLSTGQKSIGIQVYDNGYLITNIGASGKVFEIGAERAKAFIDYVRENGEIYATATYDPFEYEVVPNAGDVPQTTETSAAAAAEEGTRG